MTAGLLTKKHTYIHTLYPMNKLEDISPLELPGTHPVIAGPCSAESAEQVMETAKALANGGIRIFRAGIWKPRTMPGGFEGVGARGLEWIRRAAEVTGMLTATEVATAEHVRVAVNAGIDILWIGARTTTNPFAVQEIADAVSSSAPETVVLVKNPLNPDIRLWIGALERLARAGIKKIGAVHRGFSTHIQGPYRNEPLWNIPLELSVRYPGLSILHDPSHVGGKRELIEPLSRQALDMGFHGLIVESHCSPSNALSDAAQQVTPIELGDILHRLHWPESRRPAQSAELDTLRSRIDAVDSELLDVLYRRMDIARQIGRYKKQHGISVLQSSRFNDVISSRMAHGESLGLSADFLRSVMLAIHQESVRQQIDELHE